MEITNAQYGKGTDGELQSISCLIDGVPKSVPIAEDNRHYVMIMKLVEAGELTIAEADE